MPDTTAPALKLVVGKKYRMDHWLAGSWVMPVHHRTYQDVEARRGLMLVVRDDAYLDAVDPNDRWREV